MFRFRICVFVAVVVVRPGRGLWCCDNPASKRSTGFAFKTTGACPIANDTFNDKEMSQQLLSLSLLNDNNELSLLFSDDDEKKVSK